MKQPGTQGHTFTSRASSMQPLEFRQHSLTLNLGMVCHPLVMSTMCSSYTKVSVNSHVSSHIPASILAPIQRLFQNVTVTYASNGKGKQIAPLVLASVSECQSWYTCKALIVTNASLEDAHTALSHSSCPRLDLESPAGDALWCDVT